MEQLFDLLKVALHLIPSDSVIAHFDQFNESDWESLRLKAKSHCVEGLCFPAVKALDICPRPVYMQWMASAMRVQDRNRQVNEVLDKACKTLQEHNIPFVVMKGQTVGALYGELSDLRSPGDIDILVFDQLQEKAVWTLQLAGANVTDSNPEKHTSCRLDDVEIEVHHIPVDLFSPSALNYVTENASINRFTVNVDGVGKVPTFEPEFNCTYMLAHMVHHLLTEGLGLRQVCDWIVLMQNFQNRLLDANYSMSLRDHLKNSGMDDAYCTMVRVAHKYFNLNVPKVGVESDLEEYDDMCENSADTFINYVYESGNFGRNLNEKKDSKSLKGNLSNAILYCKHCKKFYMMAPSEVRWFLVTRLYRWIYKKFIMAWRTSKRFVQKHRHQKNT